MSRQRKVLVFSLICLAGLAVLFMAGPVQGGGKPSPPIPLWANFELDWHDQNGQSVATNIRNDIEGFIYVDTPDAKKVKYGMEVKYYPPGAWDTRGRFRMQVDQTGILGRFVRLVFDTPLTGLGCDDSGREDCALDPLQAFPGRTGTINTKIVTIETWVVYVESADGKSLVMDTNQPIGMDVMETGESKIVGLAINFTPDDPNFNYEYTLGYVPDPNNPNYDSNLVCQDVGWLHGTAEMYCVAAGQVWEFRPHLKEYTNDPGNLNRWLWGHSTTVYYKNCHYRRWHLPFVLRVGRL
jgi:hypothetical protein